VGVGDEERGTNGGEFETIKYMLYGEGKIETTMKGGEGQEVSEEVSVSKAVCPVRSLVRVIYRGQEGWFDEFQERREFLSWVKIL